MCGFAEYSPNSEERKQQVDFLWKMNYPTLHRHIKRLPENQEAWLNWANRLAEGKSFYMSLESAGVRGNAHILRQFRPADAEDDSGMSDATKAQTAFDEAGARLKRGLPDNHFSSENQRERANKKWKDQRLQVFHKSWEGKELHVQNNSVLAQT
jgi:hypothetical protein